MLKSLQSRAIIGRFYEVYGAGMDSGFSSLIGMKFASDQESETYKFLGAAPSLREWVGGRQAQKLNVLGVTIPNLDFEATLEVSRDDLAYAKTDQVNVRISEMAGNAAIHWDEMSTTLIIAGESEVCYDGQTFFDTDHVTDQSGTQTNDLAAGDYAELNVGTPTNPTANELVDVILKMVQHMYLLKNDKGKPANRGARNFLVMVPVPFAGAAWQAVYQASIPTGSGLRANPLVNDKFKIELAVNPDLTWTTKLALFRTDGHARPLILQEKEKVRIDAKAEGSEYEFDTGGHMYGVTAKRNVGYGYWEQAILATLS